MDNVASARINTFGTSPKANIVPPDDPILEIPLSEFQGLLEEMIFTHNQIAEMIRDAGILRGRELSKMVTRTSDSLKATRSPLEKLQLLNAYIRQLGAGNYPRWSPGPRIASRPQDHPWRSYNCSMSISGSF